MTAYQALSKRRMGTVPIFPTGLSHRTVYGLIMDARPGLKVICTTGYAITGPAQEIIKAGAQGVIQKPFNLTAFSAKVKAVLEAKERAA